MKKNSKKVVSPVKKTKFLVKARRSELVDIGVPIENDGSISSSWKERTMKELTEISQKDMSEGDDDEYICEITLKVRVTVPSPVAIVEEL